LLGRNTFCEGFPLGLVVFLIIIYTFAAHYEANTTDDTDVDGPLCRMPDSSAELAQQG
jgi:hypothetical protein